MAFAVLLPPARVLAAPPKVVVEITSKAEKRLDAQLARRLIRIELGDIEVPPRPSDKYPDAARTVFFRVLAPSQDRLHVELWDRGDFYGARGVSVTGSAQLRSRRIALGAAELARRLRHRRIAEGRRLEAEAEQARLAEERARRERRLQGVAVSAGARGAYLTEAGFVAGPQLAAGYRFPQGRRVELGLAAYAGELTAPRDKPTFRWLEASLRAGQGLRVGERTDLVLEAEGAAALVRVSGARSVDDIKGQADSWSARGGVRLHLEQRLAQRFSLSVGPDVGIVLRRVPYVDDSGTRQRLGGIWIGVGAAVNLEP
ncbi:MAG: hypothetical protein R3B13_13185 [Polyangiaceae bacterium]